MKVAGPLLAGAIGFGLGVLIWVAGPVLTGGENELGLAPAHYCAVSLAIGGALVSFVMHQRFHHSAIGVFLGQAVFLIFNFPLASLWQIALVGLGLAALYTMFYVAGGGLAYLASRRWQKRNG